MNKNLFVHVALIFSLFFAGVPAKAEGPDLLTDVANLARENGFDYTNPAVISAFATMGVIWGFGYLKSIYTERAVRARAKSEATAALSQKEANEATIRANNAMMAIIQGSIKDPDNVPSRAQEGLDGFIHANAKLAKANENIDKHLKNLNPCFGKWAYWGPLLTGGALLSAGVGGVTHAWTQAKNQNKTIKQFQHEKDAKNIFRPIQELDMEKRLQGSNELQLKLQPASEPLTAAIVKNIGAIKYNLTSPDVVKARGVGKQENDAAVDLAVEKAKDPSAVSGALRYAVEASLETRKKPNENSTETLMRIMEYAPGSKESDELIQAVTEKFLLALLPTMMKGSAQYTFLKEATRNRIAEEVEKSLRSCLQVK